MELPGRLPNHAPRLVLSPSDEDVQGWRVELPEHEPNPEGSEQQLRNVAFVTEGDGFSLAVDDQSRLWAKGKNDRGQCGVGTDSSEVPAWTECRVSHPCRFPFIAPQTPEPSPPRHSLFRWPSFGTKPSSRASLPAAIGAASRVGASEQLPRGSSASALEAEMVGSRYCGPGAVLEPMASHKHDDLANNNKVPTNIRVSLVSAGRMHALLVTDCGRDVFGWGDGSSGQLGNIPLNLHFFVQLPTRLPFPEGVAATSCVKDIACGRSHSVLLFEDGKVVCFGSNGQLQLGKKTTHGCVVVDMRPFVRAIGVFASDSCTGVITGRGELELCGAHSPNSDRLLAPLRGLSGCMFADASDNHVVAVTDMGSVVVKAKNGHGVINAHMGFVACTGLYERDGSFDLLQNAKPTPGSTCLITFHRSCSRFLRSLLMLSEECDKAGLGTEHMRSLALLSSACENAIACARTCARFRYNETKLRTMSRALVPIIIKAHVRFMATYEHLRAIASGTAAPAVGTALRKGVAEALKCPLEDVLELPARHFHDLLAFLRVVGRDDKPLKTMKNQVGELCLLMQRNKMTQHWQELRDAFVLGDTVEALNNGSRHVVRFFKLKADAIILFNDRVAHGSVRNKKLQNVVVFSLQLLWLGEQGAGQPNDVVLIGPDRTVTVPCPDAPTKKRIIEALRQHISESVSRRAYARPHTLGAMAMGNNRHGMLAKVPQEFYAPPWPMGVSSEDMAVVKVKFALGRNHSLILTHTGEVYQAGRVPCDPNPPAIEGMMSRVPGLPTTVHVVACGRVHCCALCTNGDLYTWGEGKQGQLGHGDTRERAVPTLVEALSVLLGVWEKVVQVSCGEWFTLALTSEGRVLGWGTGRWGEHGLGNNNDTPTSRPVVIDSLPPIVQICAGTSHSAVLCKFGKVHAFGNNEDKQVDPNSDNQAVFMPCQVPHARPVCKVVCGGKFTAVVDNADELHVWGALDHEVQPRRIAPDHAVAKIAAGTNHLVFITRSHEVYGVGHNKEGCLGMSPSSNPFVLTPAKLGGMPKQLWALDVVCGNASTVVMGPCCRRYGRHTFGGGFPLPDDIRPGTTYRGEWSNDARAEGHGKMTFPGGRFRGTFANNVYHGHGVLETQSGALVYKGGYRGGQRHGHGLLVDGFGSSVYVGGFVNDRKEGFGVTLIHTSVLLLSAFSTNVPHGLAMLVRETGNAGGDGGGYGLLPPAPAHEGMMGNRYLQPSPSPKRASVRSSRSDGDGEGDGMGEGEGDGDGDGEMESGDDCEGGQGRGSVVGSPPVPGFWNDDQDMVPEAERVSAEDFVTRVERVVALCLDRNNADRPGENAKKAAPLAAGVELLCGTFHLGHISTDACYRGSRHAPARKVRLDGWVMGEFPPVDDRGAMEDARSWPFKDHGFDRLLDRLYPLSLESLLYCHCLQAYVEEALQDPSHPFHAWLRSRHSALDEDRVAGFVAEIRSSLCCPGWVAPVLNAVVERALFRVADMGVLHALREGDENRGAAFLEAQIAWGDVEERGRKAARLLPERVRRQMPPGVPPHEWLPELQAIIRQLEQATFPAEAVLRTLELQHLGVQTQQRFGWPSDPDQLQDMRYFGLFVAASEQLFRVERMAAATINLYDHTGAGRELALLSGLLLHLVELGERAPPQHVET